VNTPIRYIATAAFVALAASGCSLFEQPAPADLPEFPPPTRYTDTEPDFPREPTCPRFQPCAK
jgi:hypothetical protein